MNELTPAPTPWLKASAVAAKWALRLLVAGWLALGLAWAGLHFWIVPRIGELRPWLEQRVSETLGTRVQIGGIAAVSNGLIPSIELSQVRLLDPMGREALLLPSVQASLSPHSLLRMGVEQLYIRAPVLDIRRAADGRFWIAGMPLPESSGEDSPALDWVLSQPELAIVGGTVQWTDELRGAPALTLQEVNLVLRKRLLTHSMRLDAQAPAAWGDRFTLSGIFREPLLSRGGGHLQGWDGQLHASFPQIDLAHLRRYVDFGVDLAQGRGALRAWVDVKQGGLTGATADVQMANVRVTTDASLPVLALRTVSGRVGAQRLQGGSEIFTQALQFETEDGLRWPGGNVLLRRFDAEGRNPAHGEIVADRLDLAAMREIAQRLPLGDAVHEALERTAARGLVEQVQGQWRGPLEQPETYAVKGRVSQLTAPAQTDGKALRPGVQGLDVDFDFNQAGGKAQLSLDKGVFDAHGILEDGPVFFEQLRADLQWQREGASGLTVSGSNVRFANADAQGDLQFKWQSAPHGPGVLDLQGNVARVEGTRVHRYMPLEMDKEVRDYVRAAVVAGTATGVKFKLKGDLARFPFEDARQGDFRISGNVQNATLAYVPAYLLPKDSLPWPALQQLYGELVIDHATLQAKVERGVLAGTALQLGKSEGLMTHIYGGAQLQVTAEAKGPLADALGVVNRSPLGGLLDNVLATASATGVADYKLKLGFPITDVNRATVVGSIVLAGNDLQITADTPRLQRARGTVAFTESGFTVTGGLARAVGGDLRIDGGLHLQSAASTPARSGAAAPPSLRIQGTATAEGLRQAKELGPLARLAVNLRGSTPYSVALGLRGGALEWQLNSSLAGMALNLPAPFAKPAEQALPLRAESTTQRVAAGGGNTQMHEQLRLELGRLASATYVRDVSGPHARVLRGAIALGLADDESAPLPDEGVVANVSMSTLDADAWSDVLERVAGAGTASTGGLAAGSNAPAMGYLPTVLAVRTKELTVGGRKLHNLVVGGGRDGMIWRANLDASELNGYLEYRQPSGANAGRVYARLARLAIGQSAAQDVENLLDDQPTSIPALDVEVEEFELRGKKLGRVDIEAVNLGSTGAREWRLNRFNIQTPEASLTASGNWTALGGASAARNAKERRRTVLNFTLDIQDSGELLNRFGMANVVRKGKGKVEGQVAWLGAPLSVDYASMSGKFNVNVETGQFLKADPGIAKLLGVLSLQSLPRRLTLDFRDVFSEGFAFDFFRGDIAIEQGIARTSNLQMKGVNAAVLMDGQADIAKETQNLRVVVVPEINAGSASVIASIINPVVGLSTFLAQLILRGPLVNAATQEFTIDGTWLDPKVTKVERRP